MFGFIPISSATVVLAQEAPEPIAPAFQARVAIAAARLVHMATSWELASRQEMVGRGRGVGYGVGAKYGGVEIGVAIGVGPLAGVRAGAARPSVRFGIGSVV